MKKNDSFLVTFVVTVALSTMLFVSCVFLAQTITVSWKMHRLTKEAKYYLEYYSAERQAEALASVNARRQELLESEDNFTAFVANCPPLGKITLAGTLLLLTVILGIALHKVTQCNKEFFIFIVQLPALAVIFVYSKVRRTPEVFQKYHRRSVIGKRKRALG